MSGKIIDITRPLSSSTACWPGDVPTRLERRANLADGDSVNLSTLTASVHNATHVDAPLHYDDAGVDIAQLDVSLYVGPCRVVDCRDLPDPIPASTFEGITLPPRVLLKTGGWPDSGVFPRDFAVLAEDAPAAMARAGVKLVGVDVPSVDKPDSKTLPIHHAIHRAGLLILESLDLSAVEAGEYELIALPLLMPGSDGSYVRAILRALP